MKAGIIGRGLLLWASALAAAAAGLAAIVLMSPAAGASTATAAHTHHAPRLAVSPKRVRAGHRVRVFGNVGRGCPRGSSVTLFSKAFSHRHDFAGLPAINARVRRHGRFSKRTRIPRRRDPGRYSIGARCGGGNLGRQAHLRVRPARRTG